MNVRYRVELSQTERAELTALPSGGKHAARKLKWAQILLAADVGASDDDIAISVGVGGSALRAGQPRGGAQGGAAPWSVPQALGQTGSPAGRNGLLQAAAGPRALDPAADARLEAKLKAADALKYRFADKKKPDEPARALSAEPFLWDSRDSGPVADRYFFQQFLVCGGQRRPDRLRAGQQKRCN